MIYEIDVTVPAGSGWAGIVKRGQRFRIDDLEGAQSVDTVFYNADNPADRHSPIETFSPKQSELATGSKLLTESGTVLMRVVPAPVEPGKFVELEAENDTLIVISNTSHLDSQNPTDDPTTPVRVLLWNPSEKT